MSRQSQARGAAGENVAESRLRSIGVCNVEQIGTPVKLKPFLLNGNPIKDVYRVRFGKKVAGDRRGELANGISVLAEVKTILDRNLRWGDLRSHQPEALSRHKGVSLLVWVHSTGIYVMRWPVPGFKKGKGITPEKAFDLDIDVLYPGEEAQRISLDGQSPKY